MIDYEKIEHDKYEKFWNSMAPKFSKNIWHYSSNVSYPAIIDFLKFCKKFNAGKSVLDVGCGNGRHSVLFAKNGYTVSGIDVSQSAIKFAKKYASDQSVKINYQINSVLNLPYQKNYFDILVDAGLFHHLRKSQWPIYLKNIIKVLKSNGYYFLLVFDRNIPDIRKFGKRSKDKSWSIRNQHYYHFFTEDEIQNIFDKDFKIIKCYNMRKGKTQIIFKIFYMKKRSN